MKDKKSYVVLGVTILLFAIFIPWAQPFLALLGGSLLIYGLLR
jgi:hypothetical protein